MSLTKRSVPDGVLPQPAVAASQWMAAPAATWRVPQSLPEALRSGPFDAALRLAIAERGLSLESLRRRLDAEGIAVSLSSLSYWQRGVRRPERAASVGAVHAMERILGLPRSSLVVLLGPPRPRGRWCHRGTGLLRFEDAVGPKPGLARVLRGLDDTVNASVRHVSMQDDRYLCLDRTWVAERVRRVVTALWDGVDRFLAVNVADTPGECPPAIRPLTGCRLGRVRADPATGVAAAELLFDISLRAGQTHVFEYECTAGEGTQSVAGWLIAVRHPLRELVLRAHFDPRGLPVRCYHVRRDRHGMPYRQLGEPPFTATGTVNVVSLDVAPGLEGFSWEWE